MMNRPSRIGDGAATTPAAFTPTWLLLIGMILALVVSCTKKTDPTAIPSASTLTSTNASSIPAIAEEQGDATHGHELVKTYECNRCHDGLAADIGVPKPEKQCVTCHLDIMEGRFKSSPETIAKWKPVVAPLDHVPTLMGTSRLNRKWVERYLLSPHDLRPNLVQNMPRLALNRAEARDIAAYLAPTTEARKAEPHATGSSDKGRILLTDKGCNGCHAIGAQGTSVGAGLTALKLAAAQLRIGTMLAPDLRHARERLSPEVLRAWLRDPKTLKADTPMPKIDLSAAEIEDISTYLLEGTIDAPAKATFIRLPVLTRKVTFDEVDKRVFHKTCWHCHAEPDYSIGDGGPGNSGGFGFKPKGLNLASYEGIGAGLLDEKGQRSSVFAKTKNGIARLVDALLARHTEAADGTVDGVRGMPLGMPGLSSEEIQLVESWVAQGRPR